MSRQEFVNHMTGQLANQLANTPNMASVTFYAAIQNDETGANFTTRLTVPHQITGLVATSIAQGVQTFNSQFAPFKVCDIDKLSVAVSVNFPVEIVEQINAATEHWNDQSEDSSMTQ